MAVLRGLHPCLCMSVDVQKAQRTVQASRSCLARSSKALANSTAGLGGAEKLPRKSLVSSWRCSPNTLYMEKQHHCGATACASSRSGYSPVVYEAPHKIFGIASSGRDGGSAGFRSAFALSWLCIAFHMLCRGNVLQTLSSSTADWTPARRVAFNTPLMVCTCRNVKSRCAGCVRFALETSFRSFLVSPTRLPHHVTRAGVACTATGF